MKVEELERFGAKLEMPKEAVRKQGKIMLRALIRFGSLGMLGILMDTWANQRRLRRDYPETRGKAAAISETIEKELFTFSALFLALTKRQGREEAYEFFKTKVMNEIAKTSMRQIYQVEDLMRCEGEVFENFKKFNVAMFEAIDRQGTWKSDSIVDERDRLRIRVVSCANVELFTAIGCPELGKLGCDHDLAGYPVILDRVNAEFRRPCTLATGDDSCDFNFYRRGTAPPTEHLNK